jgi:hypothetical protein
VGSDVVLKQAVEANYMITRLFMYLAMGPPQAEGFCDLDPDLRSQPTSQPTYIPLIEAFLSGRRREKP